MSPSATPALGQPVPGLNNPSHGEIFPNLHSKPPLAQAEVIFSCLIASCLGETSTYTHKEENPWGRINWPKQPCTPMGRGKQTWRRFGLGKGEQGHAPKCCQQRFPVLVGPVEPSCLCHQHCFPQPARVVGAKFKMANEKRAALGPREPFWSWRLSKPAHLEKREPGSAGIAGNNSNLCSHVSRFFSSNYQIIL